MRPVAQGSASAISGRTVLTYGTMTLRSTFADIVFPNMRHSAMGCSQSVAWILDGSSPCAQQVSASVARRILLPIHGGCLRACNRHGKWGVAVRAPWRTLEICSSIIQSPSCIRRVSCR